MSEESIDAIFEDKTLVRETEFWRKVCPAIYCDEKLEAYDFSSGMRIKIGYGNSGISINAKFDFPVPLSCINRMLYINKPLQEQYLREFTLVADEPDCALSYVSGLREAAKETKLLRDLI